MPRNAPLYRRGSRLLGERDRSPGYLTGKLREWAEGIFLPRGRKPYCQVYFSEELARALGNYLTAPGLAGMTCADFIRWLLEREMRRVENRGWGQYEESLAQAYFFPGDE